MDMNPLTPIQTVGELDRHIVGQQDAKKAVAIALRNRWRRQQVQGKIQDEITPKNILMIGPTGVGKTEIARRLAKLVDAPFIKVEATKFTEVGYVGRDVDQIIRDLVEAAIITVRKSRRSKVEDAAREAAVDRLITAIAGKDARESTRQVFRDKLESGELDENSVTLELEDKPQGNQSFEMPGMGGSVGMINLSDIMGKAMGGKTKRVTLTVHDAYQPLVDEEADKLLDEDSIIREAVTQTEQNGIVFLDEIDKVAAKKERGGADVSREGVQRDLLPLIEGTTVSTKHGAVKTDHILFIASGAFHVARPSDLLPELQGRLPIRVELNPLSQADLRRILVEPEASLIKQYQALMAAENVALTFTEGAITAVAELAEKANNTVENIGARRLQTLMEKVLEALSFTASDIDDPTHEITEAYVRDVVTELIVDEDLSKFIL